TDSKFLLDLVIAFSGGPSVGPAPFLHPCRRWVETSDNVIKRVFTHTAKICRALFLRVQRRCFAHRNRRFQLQKCSQLFIGTHNETLSVVAVCVSNPDCSPIEIHTLRRSPNSNRLY